MDEFSNLSFKKSEMFNKNNILKNLNLFHQNKLKSSFIFFKYLPIKNS